MSYTKYLIISILGMGCVGLNCARAGDSFEAGPIFADFPLTRSEGHRTEILGPLFYFEQNESAGQHQWAIPPLGLSYTSRPGIQYEEFDFAYPVMTWDLFGDEHRWQFLQLLNIAGGQEPEYKDSRRFTLFPIYFQQRSSNPALNYTALIPIYGHLQHRFWRQKIDFVMMPLYVKSQKDNITTWNMPYPFFAIRRGEGLKGWQLWPLYGREQKGITTSTNGFGDLQVSGGHDNFYALWPFFLNMRNDIGTSDPSHEQALVPFYDYYRSRLRDTTSYLWPIGVTHTVDRGKKYEEWDAPWPIVEFAHGEGKTMHRVLPFYSHGWNQVLEEAWVMWPIYKYRRLVSEPWDFRRSRILFFLFSAIHEKNTDTGKVRTRQDFFPFYTHEHDFNGDERLQVMSIFEPFFPDSKSILRDYSPLCAFWRQESSPERGASSQSLLWNLYRSDTAPKARKISLLFGLFQYQSSPGGTQWRVLYVPIGGSKAKTPPPG